MSATTNTKKLYSLFCVEYNERSGDLVSIQDSSYGRLEELPFEITPEDQPTAVMIFASCYPKKYETFMRRIGNPRRGRPPHEPGIRLPLFLVAIEDAHKVYAAKDIYALSTRGFIREPE